MRWTTRRKPARAVVACLLLVAGCSSTDLVSISDPEYLADAPGDPLLLGERVELAGLGQTIAYPDGWHAAGAMPYTNIAANPTDVGRWFDGSPVMGPLIFFEVETFEFMRSVGVGTSDPSPADLLDFSTRYFGWEDIRDRVRVEFLGGEGIQVRARERRGHLLAIQGVLPGDRVVLVTVVAPTESMLDTTLPTWRAMTRTLEPAGPTA